MTEPREELKPASLSLQNKLAVRLPWVLLEEYIDSIGFSSNSCHNGAPYVGAIDTGLTRLFSMAIIEFEYALATIEDAPA